MQATNEHALTHSEMIELIALHLRGAGYETRIEHTLSNGRRADIIAFKAGAALIVEVKTIFRNSLLGEAYGKYHQECTYLVYASPITDIPDRQNPSPIVWADSTLDRIGLWRVDRRGIFVQRDPTRLR